MRDKPTFFGKNRVKSSCPNTSSTRYKNPKNIMKNECQQDKLIRWTYCCSRKFEQTSIWVSSTKSPVASDKRMLHQQLGYIHKVHRRAPYHWGKTINDFLTSKDFVVLDWPGEYRVLNPIDSFRNDMKNRVLEIVCTRKIALIKRITQTYLYNPRIEGLLKKFIFGMPTRGMALMTAKNGPTKYLMCICVLTIFRNTLCTINKN